MFSKKRFALNSLSFSGTRIVMGIGTLLITPYIVLHVGLTLYGAWVLISTILGYVGLLDMSLGVAFLRLVAAQTRVPDIKELNGAAWVLTLYNLALALLFAAVAIPLAPLAGHRVFHIPASSVTTWQELVVASCVLFTFSSVLNVFSLVLNGLQLISEMSAVNVIAWLVSNVVIVVSLHFGMSVWALVLGAAAAMLAGTAMNVALVRRYLPDFRWLFQGWGLDFLRKNLRFSVGLQVSRVTELLNSQLDTLLIGIIAGTTYVSYYTIGMMLANMPKDLSGGILGSYFPEVTSRLGGGDMEGAERFYWNTLKLLLLVSFFIAGGIIVCAPNFIPVWFHHRQIPYAEITIIAALMGVANAAHLITGPGTSYLWAQGKSGWAALYMVIGTAINLALTLPLMVLFGFMGVVWGTGIGLVIGSLVFFVYFHRLFLGRLSAALLLMAKVSAAVGAASLLSLTVASATPGGGSVWAHLARFALGGILFTVLYGVLCLRLSLLDYASGLRVVKQAREWVLEHRHIAA